MKNILLMVVLLVLLSVGIAYSAGKDSYVYKSGRGDITFNHATHSTAFDCEQCHTSATGGKDIAMGKDYAHGNCKDCHAAKKVDNKCTTCHKK